MAPDSTPRRIARVVVVLLGVAVATVAGWALFVRVPGGDLTRLLGVVAVLATAFVGARVAANVARQLFASYDVAEVEVVGPIVRNAGGTVRTIPDVTADDVVEQIERADEDRNAEALLLTLNTPGGEVVPSDDIRRAAERFDGPVLAHATDVCASGGYWIASGCDELWAREGSIVGSIGVRGSQLRAHELAERYGLSYERLVAGEYKDASGATFKELEPREREYLQGLIDDYYDQFVDRVTDGRDLDAETVRETEARVYLGDAARDLGLVDELGDRETVEDRLADRLDRDAVAVETFEPQLGLRDRIGMSARRVAYAAGAGVASAFVADDHPVEAR